MANPLSNSLVLKCAESDSSLSPTNKNTLLSRLFLGTAILGVGALLYALYTRGSHSPSHPFHRPPPKVLQLAPPDLADPRLIKISFYNILTTQISDRGSNVAKKYKWENRKEALLTLLANDRPDVLGLAEVSLTHLKTFQEECKSGRLQGYKIVGFAAKTGRTIEQTQADYKDTDPYPEYGEIVAFLFNEKRLQLEKLTLVPLPSAPQQKWRRILIEGRFYDTATKTHFVCMASHFDHKEAESRRKATLLELERIRQFEKERIPWFSLGDRNWGRYLANTSPQIDEETAALYLKEEGVAEFRDDVPNYGPPGSFPGHTWLNAQSPPISTDANGIRWIHAREIDLCYRSRYLVEPIYYYAKTGEFNPHTKQLLPLGSQGPLEECNFSSDHYLVGGVFRFKKGEVK